MADDIDDLLREVEEKFLPANTNSSTTTVKQLEDTGAVERKDKVTTTQRAHSSDLASRELDDDLSDLLDDGCRMTDSVALAVGLRCKRSPRRSTSAKELLSGSSSITQSAGNVTNGTRGANGIESAKPPSIEKQKCFPIYLSGVIDSIDTTRTVRVCNQLRCTGCDFRVSQFAHYRWRPGVDYLFLRNHMPEFDRVRVKLSTAKFCRAYACQCLFVTVKDLIDLHRLGPNFASRWICLGH